MKFNRTIFAVIIVCLLAGIAIFAVTSKKRLVPFAVNTHTQVAQVANAQCLTVCSGFIAYWPLDDGLGSAPADASGNGNSATLNNFPSNNSQWTSGVVGGALNFSGGTMTSPSIQVPQTYTVSLWMKAGANSGSVFGWDYYSYLEFYSGELFFTVDGTAYDGTATSCANDGQWHNIVAIENGTSQQLYCDGALAGSASATPNPRVAPLTFGSGYSGLLDDVRVYSRALSPSEISQLYALGSFGASNNSGPNNPVTQPSGNGNNAAAPVISNLSASSITGTGATISWTTNENTSAQVLYGLTSSYGSQSALNSNMATTHSFNLSSLNAGTVYHYQVQSTDGSNNTANSPDQTFTTTGSSGSQSSPAFSGGQVYIAQTAAGNADGSSCSSPFSVAWFQTGSNWSVTPVQGKVGPGVTVNICGTIPNGLYVAGGGAAGNPLTIYFESNAIIMPGNGSAAITLSPDGLSTNYGQGVQYVTIDGGQNGLIEAVNNGSGSANPTSPEGINASFCSHCEFRNLNFENLYVHTSPSDTSANCGGSGGIYLNGSPGFISIHNNTFSNVCWDINQLPGNSQIYDNNFSNMDHGMFGGGSNISIYGNNFGSMANWDTTSNTYHHDAIHIFLSPGVTDSNINIYQNNFIGDPGGNATAYVFIENNGTITNMNIFDNVFIVGAARIVGDGMLEMGMNSGIVANNTFIGAGPISINSNIDSCIQGNPGMYLFKNNAISSCNILVSGSPNANGSVNNNIYANGGPNAFVSGGQWLPFTPANFAVWQSLMKADASSSAVASLGVNNTGYPTAGSPLLAAGANLTSYCGSIAALCFDHNGNPRPASGAWDVGAYQYSSGGGSVTQPVSTPVTTSGTGSSASGNSGSSGSSSGSSGAPSAGSASAGSSASGNGSGGSTGNASAQTPVTTSNTTTSGSLPIPTTTSVISTPAANVVIPGSLLSLSQGSRSASVVALQDYLIADGYLAPHLNTGYYGTLTRSALNTYTAAHTAENIAASSASASASASVSALSAASFPRNLVLGDSGADVKDLQIFLNDEGFTIASSGNGSKGHESAYFGPATKAALIRFQNAYASAILTPYGLTQGTGVFGTETRKKIVGML